MGDTSASPQAAALRAWLPLRERVALGSQGGGISMHPSNKRILRQHYHAAGVAVTA